LPLLSLFFHLKMSRKSCPLVTFWAPCKMYKFPLHLLGIPSDSYCVTCRESLPGSSAYIHTLLQHDKVEKTRTHIRAPSGIWTSDLSVWMLEDNGWLLRSALWHCHLGLRFARSCPVGRGFAKGQFVSQGGLTKCLQQRFRNRNCRVAVAHTIGLDRCVRRM